MSKEAKKLEDTKVESRREVIIPISLKGLYESYERITYRAPRSAFQWVARKFDEASKHMMTGLFSLVTMPLGIITRNTARVMNDAADHKYLNVAGVAGVVGAGAAWWTLGGAAYAGLTGAFGLTSTVGTVGATIAAAVVTSPVLVPAFTAGLLGGSLLLGGVVAAVSVLPAIVNLPVALRRSTDAIKGIKLDSKELDAVFDKTSLRTRHIERQYSKALDAVSRLDNDAQKKLFERLNETFGKAANATPAAEPIAPVIVQDQPVPVSAAKPKTPRA